jgi:hypothetical protein
MKPGSKICVGSGGWANIIEKFKKAKAYCDHPFEVRYEGRKKKNSPITGEWIGDHLNGDSTPQRVIKLACQDAASCTLPEASLDAVFTDPPYFGNVQYAELMDFCYVWLKKLIKDPAFAANSTRIAEELTGNADMGRGIEHFTEGLSSVFQRMAQALKLGSPLAFTYHHNKLEAYYPVAVAILDAGLTCSASLPCPAEMGASIHISGTGSSIIDTVFVCRQTGTMQRKWLADSPEELARIVEQDVALLKAGNVKPTAGDIRCIIYGHMVRLAIWSLRLDWKKTAVIATRIALIQHWLQDFGEWSDVERNMSHTTEKQELPLFALHENNAEYRAEHDDIPF